MFASSCFNVMCICKHLKLCILDFKSNLRHTLHTFTLMFDTHIALFVLYKSHYCKSQSSCVIAFIHCRHIHLMTCENPWSFRKKKQLFKYNKKHLKIHSLPVVHFNTLICMNTTFKSSLAEHSTYGKHRLIIHTVNQNMA